MKRLLVFLFLFGAGSAHAEFPSGEKAEMAKFREIVWRAGNAQEALHAEMSANTDPARAVSLQTAVSNLALGIDRCLISMWAYIGVRDHANGLSTARNFALGPRADQLTRALDFMVGGGTSQDSGCRNRLSNAVTAMSNLGLSTGEITLARDAALSFDTGLSYTEPRQQFNLDNPISTDVLAAPHGSYISMGTNLAGATGYMTHAIQNWAHAHRLSPLTAEFGCNTFAANIDTPCTETTMFQTLGHRANLMNLTIVEVGLLMIGVNTVWQSTLDVMVAASSGTRPDPFFAVGIMEEALLSAKRSVWQSVQADAFGRVPCSPSPFVNPGCLHTRPVPDLFFLILGQLNAASHHVGVEGPDDIFTQTRADLGAAFRLAGAIDNLRDMWRFTDEAGWETIIFQHDLPGPPPGGPPPSPPECPELVPSPDVVIGGVPLVQTCVEVP